MSLFDEPRLRKGDRRPGYLLGYIPLIAGVWFILYLPFILKNKKSTG